MNGRIMILALLALSLCLAAAGAPGAAEGAVPEEKALAPEDVERFIKKILGNLKFKLGAEIR